jgi:hypothetical protein
MRSHLSTLIPRMIRAGLRVHSCRYRVVAAGIDSNGQIISIRTNTPHLPNRGRHAEERVIFSSPKSLERILILRVNVRGELLPIDPCLICQKLAENRGIQIERV